MKRGINLRGQVSVFVIFAIVLMATGVIVYFISNNTKKGVDDYFNSPDIRPSYDNLKDSISDCIEYTTQDSLDIIGIQGGYYKEPKDYYDLGFAFIPYYYKDGEFLMPDITSIENELSKYIDDDIGVCLNNIYKNDFNVVYKIPKTKTTINKGFVNFLIDMPITISRDDNSIVYELKDDPIQKSSKLYEMLEIARYITDSHREDPKMICITCVADMAEQRNVYVDMLDFVDNSTLVVISENSSFQAPYYFEFLNKYTK